ncbi:hypothetical protein NFI00_000057 [Salmonella enterica]|nr:hypothetical protein [Salmonella enterica subsp. enterica serovar Minnesota]EJI5696354.1 hypothetical protein [Salmonella enterica]
MNGNHISLDVAKQEYCARHQLFDKASIEQVSLRCIGRNEDHEYVFSVKSPFKGVLVDSIWNLERHDGSTVLGRQEFAFPRSERQPTKHMVCQHFRRVTGIAMQEADISKLVIKEDRIDVIFHPDSMTFKNYLTIKRI